MKNFEKAEQLKVERKEYIKQQRLLAESLSDEEFVIVTRSLNECLEEYGKRINRLQLLTADQWDAEYQPTAYDVMFI